MPIAEERIIAARKALTMHWDCDDTEAMIHVIKEDAKMSRVWDMARAAALEEAAKECEREAKNWPTIGLPAENCARAIRALITKEITDAE